MDWCHTALAIAVIIFFISLIIFLKRIEIHAVHGNGFYDYNKMKDIHQRDTYNAGTDKRAWLDRGNNETNLQCPPAYCQP